jgi:hypothetical protein
MVFAAPARSATGSISQEVDRDRRFGAFPAFRSSSGFSLFDLFLP